MGKPHGLDGSFHVTRPRGELFQLGRVIRVGDVETEIVRCDGTTDRPILRVDVAAGREAIEALRGADIGVRRTDAPPLEDDEYYAEQLEGCAVLDGSVSVGRVVRLLGMPSCDVLEVARDAGGEPLLVPMVRDAIRRVDVARRVIDVNMAFLGE